MAKQTFTTGQVLTATQMTALQLNDYNQTVSAKVASYTLVASDAGTTITMSNASANAITVNTSLFASGDTLRVTNIGAGVCTITAGTATVSTSGVLTLAQYASGFLYFTSTGAAIWFGTASAAASSSGLTLINRASFSNVANTGTTFDSKFTSTYRSFMVVIESIYAVTEADDLTLLFRYAGTSQILTYFSSSIQLPATGVTVNTNVNNGAIAILQANSSGSVYPGGATMYFNNIGNGSSKPNMFGQGYNAAGSPSLFNFGAYNDTARSYDGFQLASSSSNITGTVAIYGLATA